MEERGSSVSSPLPGPVSGGFASLPSLVGCHFRNTEFLASVGSELTRGPAENGEVRSLPASHGLVRGRETAWSPQVEESARRTPVQVRSCTKTGAPHHMGRKGFPRAQKSDAEEPGESGGSLGAVEWPPRGLSEERAWPGWGAERRW